MMKKLVFVILILTSSLIRSDDLISIYEEALIKDPNFNLNKADLKLNKEFLNQARSALGPRLSLSGNTNWNEYYQERELQNDYNTFSYNLNFTQPILDWILGFSQEEQKTIFDAAEAGFAYQQQDLTFE